MPSSVLIGFAAGLSLIIAIGVQNVFVLRQGVRREHVGAVVAVCAASDALLIAAGIAGLGALVAGNQGALAVIKWLGAAVLIGYGLLALRRALRTSDGLVAGVEEATTSTITAVVTTCLALTWLNPHVYLDTVVLLGALANQEGETGRWFFGFGAMLASVVWFVALGYGARLLSGFMSRPSSWRILDALVAALMLTLGGLLLVR
ncbi:MAG: LysE/ArgO family amino acid transporter [Nocardioides sp.]|nr:LysE/ArgO family amino acid transporter [Nocardioides sp.]